MDITGAARLARIGKTPVNGDKIEPRKRTAAEFERQTGLLELAHDAMMVCGVDGEIRYWNSAAERLYGWPRDLAVGRKSQDLVPTCWPAAPEEIERELLQSGHWTGELRQTARDGKSVIVSSRWSVRRVRGGALEILKAHRDITAQKQVEDELHRVNRVLAGMKVELDRANLELDKAHQARRLFLAGMSHELRTPLNAVLGFTGTLLMRLPGPLTPDQEKQLRTVQSSGRHLLKLINDLLDVAGNEPVER